ncbi:MAG TPA: proline dehydrogenase family protein [Patescibacteria group bacterium]|nr:proline dehydrogenase family protein [Patescibacteria group bacterium]
MGVMKSILLRGAESRRLRERAMRYRFVRRAVRRFIPGERLEDALEAARRLRERGIESILTHLGENISNRSQAYGVVEQYFDALRRITALNLPAVVSVKLTALGLDLDREFCFENLCRIIESAPPEDIVWIDMESSSYVDATLEIYRRALSLHPNVGVCLQSYLYRTAKDMESLLPLGPAIRLVKGAYQEPAEIAFSKKSDVDQNFFQLASTLLGEEAQRAGMRAVIATHDLELIRRIQVLAGQRGLPKASFAFHMLYGIQRGEQIRLAGDGWRIGVLVSYGEDWFPWYMRRVAERPANLLFLLSHLVG